MTIEEAIKICNEYDLSSSQKKLEEVVSFHDANENSMTSEQLSLLRTKIFNAIERWLMNKFVDPFYNYIKDDIQQVFEDKTIDDSDFDFPDVFSSNYISPSLKSMYAREKRKKKCINVYFKKISPLKYLPKCILFISKDINEVSRSVDMLNTSYLTSKILEFNCSSKLNKTFVVLFFNRNYIEDCVIYSTVGYIDDEGENYYKIELSHFFRPKFVHILNTNTKNSDISVIYTEKIEQIHKSGASYYCYDGLTTKNFSRKFQGDPTMKQSIRHFKPSSPIYCANFADSPSIVVDTDRMKAISFYLKEDDNTPFLLDSHFLAFKISKNFLRNSSEYNRYKKAVDKFNKNIFVWMEKTCAKLSDVPGRRYHLNIYEKKYMIEKLFPVMLQESISKLHLSNNEMCLTPCGFDMRPYLNALCDKGYIYPIGHNTYNKKHSTTLSNIVTFCLIMNYRIAQAYESLSETERKEWDKIYKINYWGADQISNDYKYNQRFKEIVENMTDICKTGPVEKTNEWRKLENAQKINFIAEDGKIIEISNSFQFRVGYFAKLFSIEADAIRQLKSSVITKSKYKNKNNAIISCIIEVDNSTGD